MLGGEASGHLLCLDRAGTGDGIVSALQVLEALQRSGRSLAQSLRDLQRVPQQTVNLRYANGVRPAASALVQKALAQAEIELAGRGRVLVRASGTEPLVRITVETADAALMQSLLARLSDAVRAAAQA